MSLYIGTFLCLCVVGLLLMQLKVIRNPFPSPAVFEGVCVCVCLCAHCLCVRQTCISKNLKVNVSSRHPGWGETCPLHHHVERSSTAVTSLTFLSEWLTQPQRVIPLHRDVGREEGHSVKLIDLIPNQEIVHVFFPTVLRSLSAMQPSNPLPFYPGDECIICFCMALNREEMFIISNYSIKCRIFSFFVSLRSPSLRGDVLLISERPRYSLDKNWYTDRECFVSPALIEHDREDFQRGCIARWEIVPPWLLSAKRLGICQLYLC